MSKIFRRFELWQVATVAILIALGLVWFIQWRRDSRTFDAAGLIECLPPDQATHLYIDVNALRRSGIVGLIAGSPAAEEQDYRAFVSATGFDYRSDLDAVAAAFLHGDVYFALRGRFDWSRLSKYAKDQGGACKSGTCEMPASTPQRFISFYRLSSGTLALAVSGDPNGAALIGPGQWTKPPQIPAEPVWLSAPAFVFGDVKNLPAGTHSFLSPLAQAQRITFAIGPQGDRLQIRLDVSCADDKSAAELAGELTQTTDLLKKMLARDHMTPNSSDWSGVLVAGIFSQQNQRVLGTWPVERAFIQALASDKAQ